MLPAPMISMTHGFSGEASSSKKATVRCVISYRLLRTSVTLSGLQTLTPSATPKRNHVAKRRARTRREPRRIRWDMQIEIDQAVNQ